MPVAELSCWAALLLLCRLARASRKVQTAAQSTSGASQELQQPHQQTTFHHGITYVSYEGNSFWVKFNNSGQYMAVATTVSWPSLHMQQQLTPGVLSEFKLALGAHAAPFCTPCIYAITHAK